MMRMNTFANSYWGKFLFLFLFTGCLVLFVFTPVADASFLLNLGYSYFKWLDNADVYHHDISVKIDTQTKTAELVDLFHITATKSVSTIYIILGVDYRIDDIRDSDGNAVKYKVHLSMDILPFTIYRLDLPKAVKVGENTVLSIHYSHTPDTVKYSTPFMSDSLFFASVPMMWYPQMPTENFFTASVSVETLLPIVLSEGEPVDGSDGRQWKIERAVAGLNIVAGNLEPIAIQSSYNTTAWKGVDQVSNAAEIGGYLAESLPVLESKLGELNLSRVDLISLPVWYGGTQSGYTMIVVDDYLHFLGIKTPLLRAYLAAHEAAHKWFGFTAGFNVLSTVWLLEGIAEYMAYLTIEDIYGTEALREVIQAMALKPLGDYKEKMRSLSSIEWIDADQEMAKQKGALVLRALHRRLGDDAFYRGIREFLQEFEGRYASAEQLMDIMENVSGQNLNSFVKNWVDGTKVLDYALENVNVQKMDNGYQVSFKVVSKGQLTEPDPVEVDIYLKDGTITRLEDVSVGKVITEYFYDEVVRIELDPDIWTPDWNRQNNSWIVSQ
jgi:hypothetical protein